MRNACCATDGCAFYFGTTAEVFFDLRQFKAAPGKPCCIRRACRWRVCKRCCWLTGPTAGSTRARSCASCTIWVGLGVRLGWVGWCLLRCAMRFTASLRGTVIGCLGAAKLAGCHRPKWLHGSWIERFVRYKKRPLLLRAVLEGRDTGKAGLCRAQRPTTRAISRHLLE